MDRVYFDFNATTPIAREAADAMRPFLEGEFGNASCHHWAGARGREALTRARQQVASLLNCDVSELIFTSGGTEANNAALTGTFFRLAKQSGAHFVVGGIEHPSITETCAFLQRLGAAVTAVRVDRHGLIDPEEVRRAMTADTVLVSIMHANNEVGTLQPIREIATIARERGALMHTDAAQSVGKVPVDVAELAVDLLTVAGHKMYAPQGVGALYVRQGVTLEPFLHGGGHEGGRRAGTENLLEIVGLGAAAELAKKRVGDSPTGDSSVLILRDYFWEQLHGKFGERVVLDGHPELRLPNTLNVSFLGKNGGEILSRIPELAASTGSACHAGSQHMSPVLRAMGASGEIGAGAIRFSLGRPSTRREVDAVVARLEEVLGAEGAE